MSVEILIGKTLPLVDDLIVDLHDTNLHELHLLELHLDIEGKVGRLLFQ
jgi:hypothetical protein